MMTGCKLSLLQYGRIYRKSYGSLPADLAEKCDPARLLQFLVEIDPDRRKRYEDEARQGEALS